MTSWLKLWIEPSLDGKIRFEMTPAERGTYYDLQLLAKRCNQGGLIATESGRPHPKKWIAARLNVNPKLLLKVIQKGTELGLINNTEMGIYLIHFKESQSDYYRQKPYRQQKQKTEEEDPNKYVKGKYGHMVKR